MLYDIRCRDVARILAGGPRTRREIGEELSKIYPTLRARGRWVRNVLLESNPLVTRVDRDTWGLSDLGKALVRLPGELGRPLTTEEAVFLSGLLLADSRQRMVVAELLTTGRSSAADKWMVAQTRRVLEKLGLYRRAAQAPGAAPGT